MKRRWKYGLLFVGLMAVMISFDFANAQEAVTVESNVVYGTALDYTGSNVLLTLDAYYQKSAQTNRPVVILTHGGGFGAGDKGYTVAQGNFYPDLATAFAQNGFVAFSINYRLWPGCSGDCTQEIDMAVEDVMTAVGWIRAHSAHYGINATRVLIAGDSAGGGLAVNASFQSTNVNSFLGCISLWGGVPPYGAGVHPVTTCPITSQTPPTCIIHGTADTIVPYADSVALSSNLTAATVYNEMHPLEGYNHYPVMSNGVYNTNLVNAIINYMIPFTKLTTRNLPEPGPVSLGGHATDRLFVDDIQTNEWGAATNNLQMSINLQSGNNIVTNGQPCILLIRYRNLSTDKTVGILRLFWTESDSTYSFLVTDPAGKDISPKLNKPFGGSAAEISVPPGQIEEIEYNLSSVCKLGEIGTYKIVAEKLIVSGPENQWFQAVSNPLFVTVVADK